MLRYSALLLGCLPLLAQVPARDARNTDVPDTNTHFQLREYRTLDEWKAQRARLRVQILSATGMLPMPVKNPLTPQVFGRIAHKDYTVEKVLLQSLPGYWVGGNLFRPVGKSGRLPAVLVPHGHWTYGRLENSQNCSNPSLGGMLARLGFVALTLDMVGYNDSVQTPHEFGTPREQLWSFGPLGLQLWNSMRAMDFLESLPDVDPARLGATGASGGGTQTFTLAAVDDRVSFSAPVNMISAIMQGGDFCENAPGMRLGTNNVEIGAMMAPRPMLMVSATGDWTKNTPREEFPAVQAIYRLYGAADKVETVQFDSPHNYHQQSREAVYRFFSKMVLGQPDRAVPERGVQVDKLQDMLALFGRALPAGAVSYDQLVEQWITASRVQSESPDRARLAAVLATEWPARVLSQVEGERVVLSREGRGDRVPGIWRKGAGAAKVVVHPDGATAAHASGANVLAIDAFQTGSAVAPRDRSAKHFLTFNRSDDANRVQDILTAVAFLRQEGAKSVTLECTGKAAVWCTFAAAVAPEPVKLEAPLGSFRGTDEEFLRDCNIPGIQRAGGLGAARKLAAR